MLKCGKFFGSIEGGDGASDTPTTLFRADEHDWRCGEIASPSFLFSFSEVGDDVRYWLFVTYMCQPLQTLKLL